MIKLQVFVAALLTSVSAQMISRDVPKNIASLPSKYLGGLNSTNDVDCTAFLSNPFFVVNCDKKQAHLWQWSKIQALFESPPKKPLPVEMYLGAKMLQIQPSYMSTLEFSAANGVHISLDASSGNITASQYSLTAPDGKQAPIPAGSTS